VERLRDPLDPGFGYDAVTLAVPVTEPLPDTQLRLDGGALAEAELAALTDRLAARLGWRRVRRLAVADTHIPERAQLSLEALDCPAPPPPPELLPGDPPSRPLTLFDPPQPIEVIAEVPDGPPHRFRWRRTTHLVARFEGPERIAPEWWRRRDGALGGGRTRDYYRVEDTAGRRYWLFRHGLYEEGAPVWYLHGLFA
jgi:protein ImuB